MTSDPEALARLALELVAVPSVTGEEARARRSRRGALPRLPGVAVERLGNALVARVGERDDAVALVGHLDTVPPWDGHEPQLDGTRVIGRGAADMKGGDAAILAVLEHCAQTGSDVVCVFYDREEGPNRENGIHAVLADSRLLGRPAFAFVGEPTGCDVHAGCVGVRQRRSRLPRPHRAQRAAVGGRERHPARGAVPRARGAPRRSAPSRSRASRSTTRSASRRSTAASRATSCPIALELALNVRFAPGREAAAARREIERSRRRARAS